MELEEQRLSTAQRTILWGQLEHQGQQHAVGSIAGDTGNISKEIRMEDLVDKILYEIQVLKFVNSFQFAKLN